MELSEPVLFGDVCMKDAEELRDIAAYYQSSTIRYERELREWIERDPTPEEKEAALKWLNDMREQVKAPNSKVSQGETPPEESAAGTTSARPASCGAFPSRAMALLREAARDGWEDGEGELLRDDLLNAIAWIEERQRNARVEGPRAASCARSARTTGCAAGGEE